MITPVKPRPVHHLHYPPPWEAVLKMIETTSIHILPHNLRRC